MTKASVYHVPKTGTLRRSSVKKLIANISRQGLQRKKIGEPFQKELRKIFDQEKPQQIQQTQTDSLFFRPYLPTHISIEHIFEAKVGKNSLVADSEFLREATWIKINPNGIFGTAAEAKRKIIRLARKYWASTITVKMFEKYYEKGKIKRRYGDKKVWLRKKGAPATFPRIIDNPEVLYLHDMPKVKKLPKKKQDR